MKILNEMTGQEMFFLLAGPCVIEGEEMALKIAEHVSELTDTCLVGSEMCIRDSTRI